MIQYDKLPVSSHLSYHEVSCGCNGRYSDCPGLVIHRDILNLFEYLRLHCGGYPLYIGRGFSCEQYNATIPNASPTSKHKYGLALDIKCIPDRDTIWFWERAVEVMESILGGLGFYNWGVHLDCYKDGGKRRWYFRNNVYIPGYPPELGGSST